MTTSQIQGSIVTTAQQYGVDPALALAVANQESGFNQNAVSSAGAVGVFQLMPATAAGLGVDPGDVMGNITGGIQYLSQMLTRFGGNTQLALAAYNAGPGNVAKYGGVPPFAQTQNYVSSILGSIENWLGFGGSAADSSSSSFSLPSADGSGASDSPAPGSGLAVTVPIVIGAIALLLGLRSFL